MKFDTNKLRGRIVEKYGSLQRFSNKTGFKYSTLQNKLRSMTYFNQVEITNFLDWLDISEEEIGEYFFNQEISQLKS